MKRPKFPQRKGTNSPVTSDKKDLFRGCNAPGTPWFHRNPAEFEKAFCRVCRNSSCFRAKGVATPWHVRMENQVEYLLNNPQFSDGTSPLHKDLASMMFKSLNQKAERLEVAARNQDWQIPEDRPTDGFSQVASPKTTDNFDEAVRALAKAKGSQEPVLPLPASTEQPRHFEEAAVQAEEPLPQEPESTYEYETRYPSSDGKGSYHIFLTKEGQWSCECKGFKFSKRCKHLQEVTQWYYSQKIAQAKAEATPSPAPQPTRPPEPPSVPPPSPNQPFNTPMPREGVMVGGPQPNVPAAPQRVVDAWAIPRDRVVPLGAKVTLK